MKYAVLLVAAMLAACGGDDGGSVTVDAAGSGSGSGSGTNTVTTVSCTGATIAATVTTMTGTNAYMYSTSTAPSISVGGIVEFKTSTNHDVNPSTGTTPSDPGLKVGFSADVCLKFSKAGTFNFYCSVHTFMGKVTVN